MGKIKDKIFPFDTLPTWEKLTVIFTGGIWWFLRLVPYLNPKNWKGK